MSFLARFYRGGTFFFAADDFLTTTALSTMRVKRLTIKNFLSYPEEEQTILFASEPIFIVGPNGAGKSNLIRAIEWILLSGFASYTWNKDAPWKRRKQAKIEMELELESDDRHLLIDLMTFTITAHFSNNQTLSEADSLVVDNIIEWIRISQFFKVMTICYEGTSDGMQFLPAIYITGINGDMLCIYDGKNEPSFTRNGSLQQYLERFFEQPRRVSSTYTSAFLPSKYTTRLEKLDFYQQNGKVPHIRIQVSN